MTKARCLALLAVVLTGIVALAAAPEPRAQRAADRPAAPQDPEAMIKAGQLIESKAAQRDGLAISTFGPPRLVMPSPDRATPVLAGIRVANTGKADLTFEPGALTLLLQWGDGKLTPVGINRNGVGKPPAPITLKPGQSWIWTTVDARLAYIGNPKYLAFIGQGIVPGDFLEQRLGNPAGRLGLAARYEKAQPQPLTCDPVICQVDPRGLVLGPVIIPPSQP